MGCAPLDGSHNRAWTHAADGFEDSAVTANRLIYNPPVAPEFVCDCKMLAWFIQL